MEVRVIHLECDAKMVQWAKHKVSYLYHSTASEFPDGTKMKLIPPIITIISPTRKAKSA
jgi:hypothetical protein